ncbi:aldehyde dehydrogenase family protein [Leucobacter celer]|uniref:aldehyde dehydrogenase family protein n=1 Tax=Leucobacter celer TaxID=668625 RepID=UPI0009497CF4|nr:aldehyde dehydrogenase family protein [Leucobacter celer]
MAANGLRGTFIDGEWRATDSRSPVLNKFTGIPAAEVASSALQDVEDALEGAYRASRRTIPADERQAILHRVANIMEADEERFLEAYQLDTGFTRSDATGEFARAVNVYRLSAEESIRVAGEQIPLKPAGPGDDRLGFSLRVPVGVVVAIAPFNAPLSTVAHKIGPAIAAGNAVLLKPAEQTPLTSIEIVEAFAEAGLPPGYLQLLTGRGQVIGNALLGDNRVRFYTFTGSTGIGRVVSAHSGLARTHLELGSNSATIVTASADLDRVARQVARAGFRKAGQVCTSVQRVLADRTIIDDLAERLRERISRLSAGDPWAPGTDVGPLISRGEAERVHSWIGEIGPSGAKIAGGEIDGSVVTPTLLLDPDPDSNVLNREIFGPVASLVPTDTTDQAIGMINSGPYGLQAGIFTADIGEAFRAVHDLEVGGVIVNDTSSYHADAMPYSGVKESGHGAEGPKYTVEDMTETRMVVFNLGQ